jgi:hypothetical protein
VIKYPPLNLHTVDILGTGHDLVWPLTAPPLIFCGKKTYCISLLTRLPMHMGTSIKRWKLVRDVVTLAKT